MKRLLCIALASAFLIESFAEEVQTRPVKRRGFRKLVLNAPLGPGCNYLEHQGHRIELPNQRHWYKECGPGDTYVAKRCPRGTIFDASSMNCVQDNRNKAANPAAAAANGQSNSYAPAANWEYRQQLMNTRQQRLPAPFPAPNPAPQPNYAYNGNSNNFNANNNFNGNANFNPNNFQGPKPQLSNNNYQGNAQPQANNNFPAANPEPAVVNLIPTNPTPAEEPAPTPTGFKTRVLSQWKSKSGNTPILFRQVAIIKDQPSATPEVPQARPQATPSPPTHTEQQVIHQQLVTEVPDVAPYQPQVPQPSQNYFPSGQSSFPSPVRVVNSVVRRPAARLPEPAWTQPTAAPTRGPVVVRVVEPQRPSVFQPSNNYGAQQPTQQIPSAFTRLPAGAGYKAGSFPAASNNNFGSSGNNNNFGAQEKRNNFGASENNNNFGASGNGYNGAGSFNNRGFGPLDGRQSGGRVVDMFEEPLPSATPGFHLFLTEAGDIVEVSLQSCSPHSDCPHASDRLQFCSYGNQPFSYLQCTAQGWLMMECPVGTQYEAQRGACIVGHSGNRPPPPPEMVEEYEYDDEDAQTPWYVNLARDKTVAVAHKTKAA